MLSMLVKSSQLDNIMKEREKKGGMNMCKALIEWEKEAMAKGINQGMAQSVVELLEMKDTVSEEVKERIFAQKDRTILSQWHKEAAVCANLEEFLSRI